jgi:glutamine amidotransferase
MITIVDYGMGNLGSVCNMFKRIGAPTCVTSDAATVAGASKILLPGVGAFDSAMRRIHDLGLREVLDRKVLHDRVPILGICLGMQLLTRGSEEGDLPGFGWLAAATHRFAALPGIKVPHMGWNLVTSTRECALTAGLGPAPRFYFVHSYFVRVDAAMDSVLTSEYGITFDAAVCHGNVYGAQFHPEKSHKFGMQLLANFANL